MLCFLNATLTNHSKIVTNYTRIAFKLELQSRNNSQVSSIAKVSDMGLMQSTDTPCGPSLAITEEFQVGLEQKLNSSNFKSLAFKQDEFNSIMVKIQSPFNLFYMFEKYSNEFNQFNLLNFTNRLAEFKRNYSDFFIPESIIKSYTKLIIKLIPIFEPVDCYILFKKLTYLGFNLDDFASKACMQILKYHVNELDLNDLIISKYKIG